MRLLLLCRFSATGSLSMCPPGDPDGPSVLSAVLAGDTQRDPNTAQQFIITVRLE
jgi:hypothetical protein